MDLPEDEIISHTILRRLHERAMRDELDEHDRVGLSIAQI
jgi:hypothetical protein